MPEPPDRTPSPWTRRILTRQLDEPLLIAAGQRLRDRRKDKADALQWEQILDNRGKSVPVVADHLLLRRRDLTPDRLKTLRLLGMEPTPVAGLAGRILRLPLPASQKGKVKETYEALRDLDVPVSPCAVTPTGSAPSPTVVWKKSLSTPEPVASPLLPAPTTPRTPPRVAVIDTGITDEVRADGWLSGLANRDNVDPLDVFPAPNGYLDYGAGHGTFVAGIIQRLAPSVEIEVRRALDSDGITDEATVASEMVAAVEAGADVLNLSLGTEAHDGTEPIALAEALMMIKEIEERENRQIVVVAAAGNSGTTDPVYPAAFPFPSVVAVAALTTTLEPAIWSSRGEWVDCSAVGENVVSTYVQGKEDPQSRYPGEPDPPEPPDEYGPSSWAIWFGTSFAAPLVAARIAGLAQKDRTGVRDAATKLLSSAPPIDANFGVAIA
jgi:Subtilase family